MAARPPQVIEKGAGTALAPRPNGEWRELIAIQRDLEEARDEVAVAISDLERAAKSVVTTEHWKGVVARSYARRPGVWLAAAFGLGFWLGRKLSTEREERE